MAAPLSVLAEFFLGGAAPGLYTPPARSARYRWRHDGAAAFAWHDDGEAAYAWRYDGLAACPRPWSDTDMASVNHWTQHAGEGKTFVLTPKAALAGGYAGWTVRLTVVDEPGDWAAADPADRPAVLLQKLVTIDAVTGVITCPVLAAEVNGVGLGDWYHFVERVDVAAPLVLDEGRYDVSPSALGSP